MTGRTFENEFLVHFPEVLNRLQISLSERFIKNICERDWHAYKSTKAYESHYNNLMLFLKRIGDYESCIMLSSNPPNELCPSISAESIVKYLMYKTETKGKILHFNGSNVKDLFGKDIVATGSWNAPINVTQFNAAITGVHEARRQNLSMYSEPCTRCLEELENGNRSGCVQHLMKPLVWRNGNPMNSKIVKRFVMNFIKGNEHKKKSCSQICPSELIRIRTRLLSSGKVEDYMLFIFILLGIRLFLGSDELAELKVQSLVPELCVVRDGVVKSLTFKIAGKPENLAENKKKRKRNFVNITCYRDDKVPKLCPVRHFLAHIHLLGIKSGSIFPSTKEIASNSNGAFKSKLCYQRVNTSIQKVLKEVTGRSGPFTTHFMKKSAVLFAVWAGANLDDLLKACRHTRVATMDSYSADSKYMYEVAKANDPCLDLSIPQWKPVVVNDIQSAALHNSNSYGKISSLFNTAKTFISACGFPRGHPKEFNSVDVFQLCLSAEIVSENSELSLSAASNSVKDLLSRFEQYLPPTALNELKQRVQKLCSEMRNIGRNQALQTSRTPSSLFPSISSQATSNEQPLEDLSDLRKVFASARTVQEKIEAATNLKLEHRKIQKKNVPGSLRSFMGKTIQPILHCLDKHFDGDIRKFEEKYGQKFLKAPSRFTKICCSRKGENCLST